MTNLKWEEPSPSKSTRGKWAPVIGALRGRPGEWAVIAEDAAVHIGPSLKRTYPELEITMRGVSGGRAKKVYARWVEQS